MVRGIEWSERTLADLEEIYYRIIYRDNPKEEKIFVMAVIHGMRLLKNVIQ
ncbi:MAG: hypothetical protein KAW12_12955 [Candidatus Aminicenantes bacterium]|nr:hypothetical protein [Candidatus Aminicenantes bacterium]